VHTRCADSNRFSAIRTCESSSDIVSAGVAQQRSHSPDRYIIYVTHASNIIRRVLTFFAKRSAENALTVPEVLLYSKATGRHHSLGLLWGCQRSINTVCTYPSRHLFIPTPYISANKVEYTLQWRDKDPRDIIGPIELLFSMEGYRQYLGSMQPVDANPSKSSSGETERSTNRSRGAPLAMT